MPLGVPLHSRLWSGFARCQRAAEPALDYCDPFRGPERAADGGARSIRLVVAASAGMVRSAAKSVISARNGATADNSSSSPASCARVLDHGQSSARLTNPATNGLRAI